MGDTKGLSFPACYAVSIGKFLPVFCTIVMPPFSGSGSTRRCRTLYPRNVCNNLPVDEA